MTKKQVKASNQLCWIQLSSNVLSVKSVQVMSWERHDNLYWPSYGSSVGEKKPRFCNLANMRFLYISK